MIFYFGLQILGGLPGWFGMSMALLIMGASAVIYDGALEYPNYDRIWKMLSEYNATIFGISPTAVRLFKKNNVEPLKLFFIG